MNEASKLCEFRQFDCASRCSFCRSISLWEEKCLGKCLKFSTREILNIQRLICHKKKKKNQKEPFPNLHSTEEDAVFKVTYSWLFTSGLANRRLPRPYSTSKQCPQKQTAVQLKKESLSGGEPGQKNVLSWSQMCWVERHNSVAQCLFEGKCQRRTSYG